MLGLTIAALSGALALGIFVWHKVIVPLDGMNQLSEELNDPGYNASAVEAVTEASPQDSYVSFAKDLQAIFQATRRAPGSSVTISPGPVNTPITRK